MKATAGIFYSLYDGRYLNDPDDAIIYVTCTSLKEAERYKKNDWPDGVIVKQTVKNGICEKEETI